MRALSVLQVLPELETGGVERGTLEIAQALVAEGHRSTVLSNGGRLVKALTDNGSQHITLPVHKKSLLSLRLVPHIRELLIDQDVVHVRSRMPAWLVYLAWRRMNPEQRPALVSTVHGLYSINRYSAVMSKGERVIAISEAVKTYILENYGTPEDRITLIHRGVADAEFPRGFKPSPDWIARFEAEYPDTRGRILLAMPGRVTRWKGHETFIELIGNLSRRVNVHGLIIGAAAENKQRFNTELKQLCWRLGIEDRVSFLGNRNDMRELYGHSDMAFNLSTHAEPFGRTVIEAMSIGCPVVSWDYGGPAESVRALFPQGLVEPHDFDGLVATCMDLINRPEQIPAENTFLVSNMQRETLAVYQDVVAARA